MVTEEDDAKKAEKRARSEAQRLESIRAKKQLEKQRQALMSQALREVDKKKNNRVVFADSDDEEDNPSASFQNASTATTSSRHPKLFDESSEEENDEDEEQLKISNRHVGKKGEKLMKLEAQFNSDSRFHLDEKFVSSGSEDEEEDEATQERCRNLELLSKVLGSTVKPQRKTIKTVKKGHTSDGQPAFRPFTRFDPFNEEHLKWIEREKACANEVDDEKETKKGEDSLSVAEDKDANTASGIHYEMQADFAEELKTRLAAEANADGTSENGAGRNFSFLTMMGRAAPSREQEGNTSSGSRGKDIVIDKKLTKLLGDGDDNDDDDDKKESAKDEDAKSRMPTLVSASSVKFFVTGDEPYLQSLVSNFKRTQSLDKIVPRWSNHRDIFVKNYKHLRKAALKESRRKLLHDNGQAGLKRSDKKGESFPKKRKAEELQ